MDFSEAVKIIEEFKEQSCLVRDRIEPGRGRIYTTPSGIEYPSVTTVLAAVSDASWLEEWRKAVGRDVADKITKEAAARGTSMHEIIEKHLLGQDVSADKDASGYPLYRSLLIYLRKVEPISLELPVWSNRLKIAGRIDCVGLYENKLSIIDFKSSRKEKRAEQIDNYFLQCTLYALAIYELLHIECKQIVVLISSNAGFPQVFKRETRNYVKNAINVVGNYYSTIN
jgi:ATP-dependent exoDNAse (exonuclease V) beta subunit